MSHTLRIAYELLAIRTGPLGLLPLHRLGSAPAASLDDVRREARDVLGRAFGAEGVEVRERVRALSGRIAGAWEEGGEARGEGEALLEFVGL